MSVTPNERNISAYVMHYSPLSERRENLESKIASLSPEWVTEEDVILESLPWRHKQKVLGVAQRNIAADLGVNSRSLSRSRKRARVESFYLRYMSFLGKKYQIHSLGSLPSFEKLPREILELNAMHIYALFLFLQSGKEWGLFFEDDALIEQDFFNKVEGIGDLRFSKPVWINLNGGAGLVRTSSDPAPDEHGLFKVIPPNTRCATAYMINREYVERLKDLILVHGLPDWLPIDVLFQVANRKLRAKSFWSDPPVVTQGSESGFYKSNLTKIREKKKH